VARVDIHKSKGIFFGWRTAGNWQFYFSQIFKITAIKTGSGSVKETYVGLVQTIEGNIVNNPGALITEFIGNVFK